MILKPENGGPAVAFFVTSIADDVSQKPGKKAQYKFAGRMADGEGACAWIFTDTAERQFARIGLTRETASNRWLEFSKTAEGYWDINLPAGSPPAVAASPSAAPVMSAPPSGGTTGSTVAAPLAALAAPKADRRAEFDLLVKCYARCFDEAMKMAVEKLDAGDEHADMSNITHEGIAIMAGSLFNSVLQKGLCA